MSSIGGEYWASEALATEQLTLFLILGSVDLAAGKTPIENVDRCGASVAERCPIRHSDNNGGQPQKNEQDEQVHVTSEELCFNESFVYWRLLKIS